MEPGETITIESDWIATAALRRLIAEVEPDAALTVSVDEAQHRGLDPTITAAVVSGTITLLTPFVNRLVDRIFQREPKASIGLGPTDSDEPIVITASIPSPRRSELVDEAISKGGLHVTISLDVPSG